VKVSSDARNQIVSFAAVFLCLVIAFTDVFSLFLFCFLNCIFVTCGEPSFFLQIPYHVTSCCIVLLDTKPKPFLEKPK